MPETKEYRVVVNVGESFEYVVEAEDEESAEDIARERAKKDFEDNGLSNPSYMVDDVEELEENNDFDVADDEDDFSSDEDDEL